MALFLDFWYTSYLWENVYVGVWIRIFKFPCISFEL